jgi:hypothetical protein
VGLLTSLRKSNSSLRDDWYGFLINPLVPWSSKNRWTWITTTFRDVFQSRPEI